MAKKKKGKGLKGACWKGYEAIGFKMKGNKRVPNCVPKKRKKQWLELKGKKDLKKLKGIFKKEILTKLLVAAEEDLICTEKNKIK